jgi:riboflavin synthase
MFSGIVQDIGRLETREARGGDVRLLIGCARLDLTATRIGDSVCVQGCCLTVTALQGLSFAADVSRETLTLTTLGDLAAGAPLNLEPALRVGDALGGHLVSGHVDGVGTVVEMLSDARSQRLTIAVPPALRRYLARKGSVCVDGVSLTVNEVEGDRFGVNIIPHTQHNTTLGALHAGARVNLEVDLVARYIERLMLPVTEQHSRD